MRNIVLTRIDDRLIHGQVVTAVGLLFVCRDVIPA